MSSEPFGSFSPYTPVPGSQDPVPGSQGEHAPPPYVAPGYAPPPAAAAPAAGPDPLTALRQALERIDQLEQKLAQQGAGVGADVPKLAGPTHDGWLVDGTHVEITGALPTQVHLEDGRILPLAYAVAR